MVLRLCAELLVLSSVGPINKSDRFRPIPLKNSVLEPECHVIKQLEPRLFDKG